MSCASFLYLCDRLKIALICCRIHTFDPASRSVAIVSLGSVFHCVVRAGNPWPERDYAENLASSVQIFRTAYSEYTILRELTYSPEGVVPMCSSLFQHEPLISEHFDQAGNW